MFPRLLPFLLVLGLLPAAAQQVEVRALALTPGDFPDVYVQGKDGFAPLAFSKIQPSAPLKAKASGFLPVYKRSAAGEGDKAYKIASRVKLPGDVDGILLLGMANGDKVRFVAVKDDIKSAGSRDWVMINASSKPVAFQVGKNSKPMRINPGETKLERVQVDDEKGASVVAHAPFDDKLKKFYSTYWPIRADRRSMVLFVDDGRKIRVKRIADQLAPPEEEE